MALLQFFNNQGFRVPGLDAEMKFGTSINQGSISTNIGLPDYVHSISVEHTLHERPFKLSYSTLHTLLENTPRKLGMIRIWSSFQGQTPLPQEYLDFFAAICSKAERLDFGGHALSNAAEVGYLAAGLAQPSGPTELEMDLYSFNAPEKRQSLQQLFQSMTSLSLKKLEIRNIPDLSQDNLGNLLMEALKANKNLKSIEISGHWGEESHMIVEKIMSTILEHTQVEDLRLSSRKIRSFEIEDNSCSDKLKRDLFKNLAAAKSLKNLELNRNLLLESNTYLDDFEEAICRNRSLERLHMHFDYRDVRKQEWQRRHDQNLYIRLCVNRAARGLDHSAPLGLWPRVLQRAGSITYYTVDRINEEYLESFSMEDERKNVSSERSRTDVVFSLLRERVLLS